MFHFMLYHSYTRKQEGYVTGHQMVTPDMENKTRKQEGYVTRHQMVTPDMENKT